MLWFGIVVIATIVVLFLPLNSESKTGWTCGVFFIGGILALSINLGVGLLPSQSHIVSETTIVGPVVVQQNMESRDLYVEVHGADRVTYTNNDENGRTSGLDLVFEDSEDRVIQIRDYTPYNYWLSIFNYKNDDLVIKIPQSEIVQLGNH